VIARATLAAVAVAAIVLMGLWYSDFHATHAATEALLGAKADRAELERGIHDADHAGRLNPSTDPDLASYGLLLRLGQTAEANRVFASVARREPDNRTAWSLRAVTTQGTNTAEFEQALARLHKLSPLTTRRP
jgi:Flp pilus assembly protein TadD